MKKSLVLAGLLAASSMMATEAKDNMFVGIEVGSTKFDYSASLLGATISDSDSASTYSIKAGKYLGNAGRVYIGTSFYNSESNVDVNSYAVGYDYMFYNKSKFTPFIGVNVGYMSYEAKGLDAALAGSGVTSSSDKVDISGVTYGAEIGGAYEVHKNFDIEVGARFIMSSADDSITFSDGTDSVAVAFEIDNPVQWYVGLNYNF